MPDKESLYPLDWFKKGQKDLKAVETLLSSDNLEVASFHIQQAIEKYLKGYLLSKGWQLRRIHDLEELLDEVVSYDTSFEKFRSLCQVATEYYIEERYPFLIPSSLYEQELQEALKDTKKLVRKITNEVK
ncbi:MAG TPA: HEPN domain-containing protein [Candidatus Brocadiales bacterium]|nr:HEPN domain-containing protein [Candidatus Brocadiales bacterium]